MTIKTTAITAAAIALFACSDEHGNQASKTNQGTGGSMNRESSGGTSGATLDASESAGTLCDKYGGPDVVMTVMQENVVGEIAADCRINGFFAPLRPETLTHIGECLGIMAQELFGCPSVTYAGSTTPSGYQCHDMKTAHLGLAISQGDFDALIEDVVAALSAAGIEESDIMAAAPALLGMQSDIVEVSATTPSMPVCEPPAANGGGARDSGAKTTTDAGNPDGG